MFHQPHQTMYGIHLRPIPAFVLLMYPWMQLLQLAETPIFLEVL
jgi:hypothetical protein